MDIGTKSKILACIDREQETLFSLLSQLIQINSENFGSRGNEQEIAAFISRQLQALSVENSVYCPDSVAGLTGHPEYLPGRNTDSRPNVTGIVRGSRPTRSLMFTAHTDTVPIGDKTLWQEAPLGGEIRDGRIYGRGACDDKYAIAAVLFLLGILKKLGITLANDLYFTGYCDEEFGGGNGALGACLKYPCDVYVNLDCKNMRIWNCAVGGRRERLTLGKDAACNSCDDMLDGIWIAREELRVFGENRRQELSANPHFAGTNIPKESMRILNLQSGLNTNDKNRAHIEFAYYTDKTEAEIALELTSLTERINRRLADQGVCVKQITPMTRYFRCAASDSDNEYIRLLRSAADEAIGEVPVVEASCLSDLNILINNGSRKSFSFGIGRDFDVEGGAHLKDEFIECDRLVAFTKAIAAFLCDWDMA